MFNLKKNMKRLGAGIMASLCAVSLFSKFARIAQKDPAVAPVAHEISPDHRF